MSAEDALRFAQRVERLCSRVFGSDVVGVILHGSLTLGDYVPGRSDVDVLAIVQSPITDEQLAATTAAMAELEPQAPARVDLRIVTRDVAADPSPAPPMELYAAVDPRSDSGPKVETRHPERDLVVEFSMCRAHGRTLAGSEPSEVIGEVPDRWVLEVGDAQLADWQRLEFDQRYGELIVLTACRVWRFSEEGRHCSKFAAGEWALAREPSLRAVREALHQRHVDRAAPIEESSVFELLTLVRDRVADVVGRT